MITFLHIIRNLSFLSSFDLKCTDFYQLLSSYRYNFRSWFGIIAFVLHLIIGLIYYFMQGVRTENIYPKN